MSDHALPGWREAARKRSIADLSPPLLILTRGLCPESDRVAAFDNDGTLWTERPLYAQLAFAIDRAAELGHPTSLGQLQAGGMPALLERVTLTHAGITTDEFDAVSRRSLAAARHPRFGRPYPQTVYQPMLELHSEREYAYDRDPILGSGTEQILAAAADHHWTVTDMAADWSAVHPPGAAALPGLVITQEGGGPVPSRRRR